MSYILEALRKAERERAIGQVPSIEMGRTPAPEGPRPWWPWLLGIALLVNAGVLAGWLWSSREPVPLPPLAETAPAEPQVPEPTPSVSDYLPPPTTVLEETPPSEPPVVHFDEPVSEPLPPAPQAETETQETFVEEAPDEYIEETPVAEEPPLLRDMPADFRRSVPEMKIDAHFYTDVPGRSFVMINLRKYRPGERLQEGPQLVDIIEAGVILSYQGREFLLAP